MSGLYASTTMPCFAAQRERCRGAAGTGQLDLIDGRDVLGGAQAAPRRCGTQEVADADRARALLLVEALQRAPGVEPLAGDRPVEQVEVDVIQAEALQAGVEGAQRAIVALVVVPELGRHEHLLARDAAVANAGADVGLVAVDARGVDVAVAEAQRRRAPLRASPSPRGRLPDAEPDLRNHGARIQTYRRVEEVVLISAWAPILRRSSARGDRRGPAARPSAGRRRNRPRRRSANVDDLLRVVGVDDILEGGDEAGLSLEHRISFERRFR